MVVRLMTRTAKPMAEIVRAAEALDEELVRLETTSRSVRRIRLDTDKALARAAAELKETLALPERLAQRLQALGAAMARLQERQQEALAPLAMFAVQLQERMKAYEGHMHRFAVLGQAAGELNATLAGGPTDMAALVSVDARLQEIADAARTLFEGARDDGFPEIAREADVLKQRMSALRKRLPRPA
jgi:chromosome segregation ATPase